MSFLLIFALCFSLIEAQLIPSPPGPTDNNLMDKACSSSQDKAYCLNLLQSDRTSPKADMKGLAFIALRTVEKNASATSLFIKETLDKPEIDLQPGIEDALSDCDGHYLNAIELVEDSINALVSNAPDDVTKFMKAAVADLDGCDASVKGQGNAAAEVASKNVDLRKLIDTSLSVFQVSQSPLPT
ncbi:hypothetical protein M9H77_01699 [Catharanthus roseus]|uniref:Uncharacterized protein n=1 Tax=Catharanthus roseus TaxID=4058 RepID=A0ACC0C6J3_CATRO|nr:hypothetical protein M9H77_01699 [Catharanthus roseus]